MKNVEKQDLTPPFHDPAFPLRWAVEANNSGMVRALLALGADPGMPDDKGEAPRDVAQRKQRLALIQIFDQARQAGSSF